VAPRKGSRALRVALCALVCLCATALAAPDAGAATPSGTVFASLSNLRTESRWAYPVSEATIRSAPDPHSRSIGTLHFLTIDSQAQLYEALTSAHLADGQSWVKIEVPGRPNGRRGWVPADALGKLNTVHEYLRVDESKLNVTLYKEGHVIFSAPVGVGKASTVTPTGHFYVLEKLVVVGATLYGPFALGTSAYAPTLSEWPGGGVVGIHGTNEPELIPGRPSHGCVRMRNSEIAKLWSLVSLGTPIDIVS
jgi:hypothetical protein